MTHLSDDDLILLQYGEAEDAPAAESHLSECADCRRRREELQEVLAAADPLPVPERGPDYGADVWRRIAPRLALRPVPAVPRRVRWAPPVALAASLLLAFLLGRHWPAAPPPESAPGAVRERILLVAVGEHLERSQMVLVEIANADPQAPGDIAPARRMAQELVDANRLYRVTAQRSGEAGVADVLDDLERTLLEIAHSPEDATPVQLKTLQKHIESRGLLFKVRVIGSRVRERQKEVAVRPGAAVS